MSGPATFPFFDVDSTLNSQFANSPILVALVEAASPWFDPSANLTEFFNDFWNIDTAVGSGLDTWGVILGVSRVVQTSQLGAYFGFQNPDVPPDWQPWGQAPFYTGQVQTGGVKLNDSAYRTLLLTKALANIVTTTAPGLNALVRNLFPGRGQCYVLDLGQMAMRYVFKFPLSTVEFAIISFSGVLPHPAGVQVSVVVAPEEFFGFAEATPGVYPFGEGVFYLPGGT